MKKQKWFGILFCSWSSFSVADNLERFDYLYSLEEETGEAGFAHAVNTEDDAQHWNEPTPSQIKGPFYPVKFPTDKDADLTVKDNGPVADGVQVHLQGQVSDQNGAPLVGATVEIWQACQSGRYNHPQDTNSAPVDPKFQYYGVVKTDSTGKYAFKTIVPGPYPADTNWWRPPHIHFMVAKAGFKPLITQLYFDGNSFSDPIAVINGAKITGPIINNLNELDYLINEVPKEKQKLLIVSFKEVKTEGVTKKLGVFNIYLEKKAL